MEEEIENIVVEEKLEKPKKVKYIPSKEEVLEHLKKEESWCMKENKFVYNPKKRKHCPYCGGKF